MNVATALAAFFVVWWVSLFLVLPWGVRSQHEGDDIVPGTDPGAPTGFRLGRTLLWTTVVAVVIYAALYVVYTEHLVTLAGLMGSHDFTK